MDVKNDNFKKYMEVDDLSINDLKSRKQNFMINGSMMIILKSQIYKSALKGSEDPKYYKTIQIFLFLKSIALGLIIRKTMIYGSMIQGSRDEIQSELIIQNLIIQSCKDK